MSRRRRLLGHQWAVVPAALFCSAALAFPAWYRHTLHLDGPVYADRAAAEAWGRRTAAAQRCLPVSIDIRLSSERPAVFTADRPAWFATLRCNQPRIYARLALVLFAPWLLLSILARTALGPDRG